MGPGAEFDAIRSILRRLGTRAEGVGDDAAVFSVPRGDSVVVSVDASIEGTHFKRDWMSPRDVARRAVSAALSDLAAMAARPIGVLVALGVSEFWRQELELLADGIGDAVGGVRARVLGGNVSEASELSITTTVIGSAFAPLARSGAAPGDSLYVTGSLGGPGAALALLSRGESAGRFHHRFVHPAPRIDEARWLADRGATAAIDVSDGLVADLRHLAAASGVRIELDATCVPLVDGVALEDALASGEEYELVVAARDVDTAAFAARFNLPLTRIGRVAAGPAQVDVTGARVAHVAGHDHFSR